MLLQKIDTRLINKAQTLSKYVLFKRFSRLTRTLTRKFIPLSELNPLCISR